MKIRKYISVIFFVLVFVTLSAQNLAQNPGFEDWTDDLPNNWFGEKSSIAMSNVVQSIDNPHGGESSCQLINESNSHKRFTTQGVSVVNGTEYTIEFWVKGEGEIRTGLYDTVSGGSGYTSYNDYIIVNSSDWAVYTQTITSGGTSNLGEFIFSLRNTVEASGHLLLDDVSILGGVVFPEPTNHVTNFTSNEATGLSIELNWIGSIGEQLPSGYLLIGKTGDGTNYEVIDGSAITNDSDWSDNNFAINLEHFEGGNVYFVNNLEGETEYSFKIFPYTNSGETIDYKSDEPVPEVIVSTLVAPIIINIENFEDGTLGTWSEFSVASNISWESVQYGDDKFAKMTGYGADEASNDWLISPQLDLSQTSGEILSFDSCMNYEDTTIGLEIKISTDYDGSSNPEDFTWEILSANLSQGGWAWTPSGDIDLSNYDSENVYIAFHYICSGIESGESRTWEIDNIMIFAEIPSENSEKTIPGFSNISLKQNIPNPFNPTTSIEFSLKEKSKVQLAIYNVIGQKIKTIVNEEKNSGTYSVVWNGKDDSDNEISSGVYFFKLTSRNETKIIKSMLIK